MKKSTYITNYIRENLDEVKIRIPKGQKEKWQEFAKLHNESLNALITRSINQTIREYQLMEYPIVNKKKEKGKNLFMNLTFRDDNNKLYSKNILNISLNMEVVKKGKLYVVQINPGYYDEASYDTVEDAEERMYELTALKNRLESELRDDS